MSSQILRIHLSEPQYLPLEEQPAQGSFVNSFQSAEMRNAKGGTFKVRNGAETVEVTFKPSATLHLNAELATFN